MKLAVFVLVLAACGHDAAGGPSDAPDTAGDTAGDGPVASRCRITPPDIACDDHLMTIDARDVAYQVPLGTAPASGWPAVVYYQGSFLVGTGVFAAQVGAAFGQYNITLTVKALLDGGYAVIAPDATAMGTTYWDTNIPPYTTNWAGSPDDILVTDMLAAIHAGTFGPIDATRLYAMGISSGGFMTSRMAVSYPGAFRALADQSGSYATCGATCTVPTPLPANHPPILFLHGDTDTVVPMSSVQPYLDALQAEGHETQLITDASAGHEWLAAAVTAIPAWFTAHP